MRRASWAISVFLGLVACAKSGPPRPPSTPGAGFDERQVCGADKDCAVVEIECCDHCNGGTAVGVHKDAAADVKAEYAAATTCERPQAGSACTAMACSPAKAVCRQERCGVSIDGTVQMTPLPRP